MFYLPLDIQAAVAAGKSVVYFSYPRLCPHTDAILGAGYQFHSAHDSRKAAEDAAAAIAYDGVSEVCVVSPAAPVVVEDSGPDDVPF